MEAYSERNMSRLSRKLSEAEEKGEITICYMGGSVTEGQCVKQNERFSALITDALRKNIPAVNEINLGAAGVSSIFGLYQSLTQVPSFYADIIFLEFSINDMKHFEFQGAYESMVVYCLQLPQEPAVVQILLQNQNGYTCQAHMNEIGKRYQIPAIQVQNVLQERINNRSMQWSDYSFDYCHPHSGGHQLIADGILQLFETARHRSCEVVCQAYKEPVFTTQMKNLIFLNTGKPCLEFHSGEIYKYEVNGQYLFLLYDMNCQEDCGSLYIETGEGQKEVVRSMQMDGWKHSVAKIVRIHNPKEKRITLSVKEEGKVFYLWDIGWC